MTDKPNMYRNPETLSDAEKQIMPRMTDKLDLCRNQLRDNGKPYPRSGCAICGNGGMMGCPYERGTDKPSQWALDIWFKAYAQYFYHTDQDDEAAALIIEQARTQWEREICEWLERRERDYDERNRHSEAATISIIADAIERGEHREGK